MKETVLETLEKSGLDAALICFDELADKRQLVKLKVAFANEVKHLMPEASKSAFGVAERYANGLATEEELNKASGTADAAWADRKGAWIATHEWVACTAARVCAYATDAARGVADAALAALAVVWAADAAYADDAAVRKERKAKQVEILKQFLEDTE